MGKFCMTPLMLTINCIPGKIQHGGRDNFDKKTKDIKE
jgi:hypothetical protein